MKHTLTIGNLHTKTKSVYRLGLFSKYNSRKMLDIVSPCVPSELVR